MQQRKWIAAALSLITVFGGHWINRRWDRILLFVLLLYLLPLVYFATLSGLHSGVTLSFRNYGSFIGLICLLSAGIAYMDAVSPEEGSGSKIINGIIGSLFTLAGIGVVVSIILVQRYMPDVGDFDREPSEIVDTAPELPAAQGYLDTTGISYGEFDYASRKLLGDGEAKIVGRVTADGQPVEGLRLRLKVKPDIRTKWVTTDASGHYTLAIPPGKYEYMGFDLDRKSANRVLKGMIMLDEDRMWSVLFHARQGESSSAVDFRFAKALQVTEPLAGDELKPDEVAFKWKPVAGADHYTLMIYPRGKDGRHWGDPLTLGEHSHGLKLRQTSFSPASAGIELKPGEYYEWQLRAYDGQQHLLSKAPDLHGNMFKVR